MRADGLGANVIVTEVDPIRALEARMDGYGVMKAEEAVKHADMLLTVTGDIDIITEKHLKVMKDGCILANSGHFNVEINKGDLEKMSVKKEQIKSDIEGFVMEDGREFYLLADGRLVNLAGERGQGHPAEIMDMSFSVQALAAKDLLGAKLENKVYKVSDEIDDMVARLKLKAMDIEIDELTPRQSEYMENWEEGT
jgi:adenosylhomocysteinase